MKQLSPILSAAFAFAWVVVLSGTGATAGEESKAKPPRPALAKITPKPPLAWLAPYAAEDTDEGAFDVLRERLFRLRSDADLIRGLAWLSHARTKEVRVAAARGLADAYLLGDHLGADPVPGIRAFAQDADPFVRTYMLRALAMHDSPLVRELLLQHHVGQIPVPKGAAGMEIRAEVHSLLQRYATAEQLSTLVSDGRRAQRAWFDDAEDRVATKDSHRFETGELKVGEANRRELASSPGTFLWFSPVRTLQATGGWISSGDGFALTLDMSGGGMTSSGGASIYGGGISSISGRGSAITHARNLGNGTIRYWIRVSPSGRSMLHHQKSRRWTARAR